jgi:hypothetical protein
VDVLVKDAKLLMVTTWLEIIIMVPSVPFKKVVTQSIIVQLIRVGLIVYQPKKLYYSKTKPIMSLFFNIASATGHGTFITGIIVAEDKEYVRIIDVP